MQTIHPIIVSNGVCQDNQMKVSWKVATDKMFEVKKPIVRAEFVLLSMEFWAAAKKVLSWFGGTTSSYEGSWPKATYPEGHVS